MFRAFILAIGATLLLLAAECILLDHVELRQASGGHSDVESLRAVEFRPPTASPTVLLVAGSLIVLGSWRVSNRRATAILETPATPVGPSIDSSSAASISPADELLAREDGELTAWQELAALQAADDSSFFDDDDDDSFFADDDDELG